MTLRSDTAIQLRTRIAQLEAQLQRIRQKGERGHAEDQVREELEKYRQALSYLK